MQSKKMCMRYFISGHVQGVWFRSSAQDEAKVLGLTGWARNLQDGRVEVLACGEQALLSQFNEWLCKGPELARVDDVQMEESAWEDLERFSVK
jgi:acylphosphatase